MPEKGKSETARREEEILAFWKDQRVFQRSLEKRAPKGEFVFYDGPPFATGLPHSGSLLSSIIKDVIPRYKTMQGYRVPRRWGWDCHGLPIESLIEKRLNLKTKKDILDVGIDTFNEAARASVMEFAHDWEKYVDRVGRWVDFNNSYKTMDNSYIESVWWALKKFHGKKMLYEGRKVLLYCTHCETPLAKAEIAMDNTYKDVTEEAVTVKFKVKHPEKYNLPANTYFLAWTTTPWTLPGNVGLAVGKDIEYAAARDGGAHYITATAGGNLYGKDLVGIEYEPLFDVPALKSKKSYKVYAGDFVSTEEGTGIVHTAVMYGEDDFALGQKEGLPMVQLLNANGTYNDLAPEFIRGEYLKKAQAQIKERLEEKGLLFEREQHTHSYPHCYRCGTPLIYNAVASWFINIQKIKKKMLSENEQVNWVPEHLKEGRFKHIVENAPDWTISRNRFWASPLPIWKEKGGSKLIVIGSIDELLEKTKKSGNEYFVMRHGEALHNTTHTWETKGDPTNHLTERGRDMVRASAESLKAKTKIDMIVASPLLRTQQTAKIAQEVFGLPDSALMTDERLREMGVGAFEGKTIVSWRAQFSNLGELFDAAPEGAETYTQIRQRVGKLLFEVERRYSGKKILFVTHESTAWLLNTVAQRWSLDECRADADDKLFLTSSEWKPVGFVPYPHNAKFEPDLHRPYIDHITLADDRGSTYERTPEVIDCWVESGAMPYASNHYPFENKDRFNPGRFFGLWPKGFPADFIAEYIAQTRTWFYYMHAMGAGLSNTRAFKNVVSTGTILAADGSKMSKSKGNYTDPLSLLDQFGADAFRLYLMGSVVMSGEDLNFKDEDVREAHNRVIGILWNCYKFFELYKHELDGRTQAKDSVHVLDRWVLSLLGKTIAEATAALDAYDTPNAVKTLRAFIDDYSTWYVRRSRDRVKGEDAQDKQYALAAQREVLLTLSKLLAPLIPFLSESVYRAIGDKEESVHLCEWPNALAADEKLLSDMRTVREIASKALEARERAGIKIRQPLNTLKVRTLPLDASLVDLIAEEVNVKQVVADGELSEDVWLDIELTAELREEGAVRALVRRVQEWRKEQGLTISDRPVYTLSVSDEEREIAKKHRKQIIKEAGLKDLEIS
jgi:isoleucyl-tRNA synthetase